MSTYTWKIESVHPETGTMEVQYTTDGHQSVLNLPMPDEDVDVGGWVDKYAPRSAWTKRTSTVQVGTTGTSKIAVEIDNETEIPNTIGNWQEEYLRAMIYSVLEEIHESSV